LRTSGRDRHARLEEFLILISAECLNRFATFETHGAHQEDAGGARRPLQSSRQKSRNTSTAAGGKRREGLMA